MRRPRSSRRFRTLMVLGYPLRLGQVAGRLWRSCVDLRDIGEFGCGRVFIPESDPKPSAGFDFDPIERAWVGRALSGYLRELEEEPTSVAKSTITRSSRRDD